MASDEDAAAAASDYQIRTENAYPGATNSIGSVHQRRWFITLDRPDSGFMRSPQSQRTKESKKAKWIRKRDRQHEGELLGFEPFYVRGPDVEMSVVTGRREKEVLEDEGVKGFVRRRGWRAVTE